MDNYGANEKIHKLIMTGRDRLVVSGVEDVESFDEDTIVAYTTDGTMTVKGADFKINRLNVDIGELEIEGEIDIIQYDNRHKSDKGSFFSKIFK